MIEKNNQNIIIDSALSQEILNKMFAGVCLFGWEDLKIKYVNPLFASMVGYTSSELIGQASSIVGLLSEKTSKNAQFLSGIKENSCWQGEIISKRKDGTQVCFEAKLCFVKHSEHGNLLLGVFLNITEQKNVGKQLNDKVKELEKVVKLMVGRELKMVELKGKIEKMEKSLALTQRKKKK